jgi:hypothetical protein
MLAVRVMATGSETAETYRKAREAANGRQGEGKDSSFLEKKKQKIFFRQGALPGQARPREKKFFGSFFQKRTPCFPPIDFSHPPKLADAKEPGGH